jgi:hypothetical protein
MSRPEDIPESVWLEAGMLFDRLYDAEPNLEGGCYQGVTDTIARAIMAERAAERERCASIADAYEVGARDNAGQFDRGFDAAAFRIARAIRGQP